MRKRCLAIVILEDERQEMLVRRYLRQHGLGSREMNFKPSPSGQGSAEQWVRKAFVDEVQVYRNRHRNTKVIVMIDGDTHTVQQRLAQLDQALIANGKDRINTAVEEIARLVPKRNIETWILCLNNHAVDEETNYKRTRDDWNALIPTAAETLFEYTRPYAQMPVCMDSLQSGITELKRLNF